MMKIQFIKFFSFFSVEDFFQTGQSPMSSTYQVLHLSGTQCYLPYCIIQFILPMFTIAFGGRLQQSGRRIEKCSNKSGNPISKPNIGPVGVLLASKRAHSSKIFSQARNFYISNLLREALLMKQCKCINISNFGPFLC